MEHPSDDDCAIIAEIGKSELRWSAARAPEAPIYADLQTQGSPSFLVDCPWTKLGLAEPRTATPDSPMGFLITRPVYSGNTAQAWFLYRVTAIAASDGTKIPPFGERELCTLEKAANGWHLNGCKLTEVR